MTPQKAIEQLAEMQKQIIDGSNIFRDIAEVIGNLDGVRLAALSEVAASLEELPDHAALLMAHRILANNNPDGMCTGDVVNSANRTKVSHAR